MFEGVAQQVGEAVVVEVGNADIETRIGQIVKELKESSSQKYVVYKFVARIKVNNNSGLIKYIEAIDSKKSVAKHRSKIDIKIKIQENFVLKNY